jgi:hypothetical protein
MRAEAAEGAVMSSYTLGLRCVLARVRGDAAVVREIISLKGL